MKNKNLLDYITVFFGLLGLGAMLYLLLSFTFSLISKNRIDNIKLNLMINNEPNNEIKNAIIKEVLAKTGSTEEKSDKLLKVQDLNIGNNNIVIEVYK